MSASENKVISHRDEFQEKVLKAVEILAKPVVATLGPDGQPILLERKGATPLITKDGVTVANSIFVSDPVSNVIIQAIKEASMLTNNIAGDGTTTAILLTHAIIKAAQPYLRTKAITPQKLGDNLAAIAEQIVHQLNQMATPINQDFEQIKNVANISCNGDTEIAEIVAKAIDSVGVDGVVTLEESVMGVTNLRIEEGFSISRGWGSLGPLAERFLINSKATQEIIYKNAAVILYNGIVDNVNDFFNALSKITCNATKPIPIVVLAQEFSPQILNLIFTNAAQGTLQCLPMRVPKLGSMYSQTSVIEDLATLTGGKVIEPGLTKMSDIENDQSEFLGGCERIVCSRKETIIYGGKGSEDEIKQRADFLREQVKDAPNEWDKDILKERLGRLVGGIAVIEVGGVTDLEMKEKKDRIEDALNATRAALEQGVVPGGGSALLKAFQEFSKVFYHQDMMQKMAFDILEKVSQAPIRQIILNTERTSPDVVIADLLTTFTAFPKAGYNARKGEKSWDMVADGIIDPLKVTKTAFTNAISIATTLLRGGGSIVHEVEKTEAVDPFANAPMYQDEM